MAQEYTRCAHCAVKNQPGRMNCWQCGYKLPTAIGLDGHPIAVKQPSPHTRAEEVERLLAQAETLDMTETAPKPRTQTPAASVETPQTAFRGWLQRLKNRHSEA